MQYQWPQLIINDQFGLKTQPFSTYFFRRSSAREGRPPSAFSVSTFEFEASTSRPTSGSTPTSTLDPLVDFHRPVILPEGLRVVSPHVPRPPSGDPHGRPRQPSTTSGGTSGGEPPSPIHHVPPTPTSSTPGQKSLIKHKLERQRSRSINELALPLPSCHAHHETENETSDAQQQRRVQSGPKERTTPEPTDDEDERTSSTSAKAGEHSLLK